MYFTVPYERGTLISHPRSSHLFSSSHASLSLSKATKLRYLAENHQLGSAHLGLLEGQATTQHCDSNHVDKC